MQSSRKVKARKTKTKLTGMRSCRLRMFAFSRALSVQSAAVGVHLSLRRFGSGRGRRHGVGLHHRLHNDSSAVRQLAGIVGVRSSICTCIHIRIARRLLHSTDCSCRAATLLTSQSGRLCKTNGSLFVKSTWLTCANTQWQTLCEKQTVCLIIPHANFSRNE